MVDCKCWILTRAFLKLLNPLRSANVSYLKLWRGGCRIDPHSHNLEASTIIFLPFKYFHRSWDFARFSFLLTSFRRISPSVSLSSKTCSYHNLLAVPSFPFFLYIKNTLAGQFLRKKKDFEKHTSTKMKCNAAILASFVLGQSVMASKVHQPGGQ